jgi:hypothetical protein
MPTIEGVPGPHRLFFYSFDCNEPMHVHAERERMKCKFWLSPLFPRSERRLSAARAESNSRAGDGAQREDTEGWE